MKWLLACLAVCTTVLVAVGCGGGGGSDPTPPSQWSITAAGGTFQSFNGQARLVVPAGAVAAPTNVTATQATTAPTAPSGHTYVNGTSWSFTHVNFTSAATLTISYPAAGVPAASVSKLKLFRKADGSDVWTPVATTVDAGAYTASASVVSFSSYALFYPSGTGWSWTTAGGVFDFENLQVDVPSGAVASTVEVQPRRTPSPFTPPTGWVAVSDATFDLGASDVDLHTSSPVAFSITYAEAAVPADARANVKVFYKENASAAWVQLTTTSDVPSRKATAQHSRLGTFALFYPTAVASILYVEERNVVGTNDRILDIYAPSSGGEQHLYSATINNSHRLIPDSYRDSDRCFLELEFVSSQWLVKLYNVETHGSTQIHNVSPDAGWRYESIQAARSTRFGPARDVIVSTQEVNTAGTMARDRLLLYRQGEATPRILASIERDPSSAPAILRGMDTGPDGTALAWTPAGLVRYTASGHNVLGGPEFFPQQARFSPTGSRVLFLQLGGAGIGWKLVQSDGVGGVSSIDGLTFENLVRWGADDGEVLVSSASPREIRSLILATGVFRTVATTSSRNGVFVDIGIQAP